MKGRTAKKIAIVTGASSGIGREFVKQIAKSRTLDEIWVIARRKDRLEELWGLCGGMSLRVIPLDLTEKSAFDVVRHALEESHPDVRMLINAAGIGKFGMTRDLSIRENDQMIDLNCRAAVDMSLLALPYMSRGSELINVCSAAGFAPLTGMNTYAATKAFLLNWTKALHHELLFSGIHVTALCPYWVKDTEFIPIANETDYAPLHKGTGSSAAAGTSAGKTAAGADRPAAEEESDPVVKRYLFAGHAKMVVRQALRASRLNMWVASPGGAAKAERLLSWVVPDFIIVPVWDILRRL